MVLCWKANGRENRMGWKIECNLNSKGKKNTEKIRININIKKYYKHTWKGDIQLTKRWIYEIFEIYDSFMSIFLII